MPLDVRSALSDIPAVDRFPTVDEIDAELDDLARRHPDLVRVRRIGTSRQGHPIRMAVIGGGTRNALVFAGPHPNEPAGFVAVRELARLLCANEGLREALDYRWHLVPCVDPDGARLNEGWYGRPHNREHYARGVHRPAIDEQVEWTFPHLEEPGYFDRVLPETAALARVIDDLGPVLQCSLHNGDYGGAFYYVSSPDRGLAEALAAVPGWEALPVHRAVWEVPDSHVLAPGVMLAPTAGDLAGLAGASGGSAVSGASSADYARRHGTVTVVTEVPCWEDPLAADTSPCGIRLGDVVEACLQVWDRSEETLRRLAADADADLRLATPFHRAFREELRMGERLAGGWRALATGSPLGGRNATVAEQCAFDALPQVLRLRLAGTLLRLLDSEAASGNVRPAIRRTRRAAEDVFAAWLAEAESALPGKAIDIRRQVAVQVGSVLTAAATLTADG